MPKVNKFDQKRLIYYANRSEHKAFVDFVKARGLYLIPLDFKDMEFSEEDLLSGKIDACNLSPIPFEELVAYPIIKRRHRNSWYAINRKYPIISWLWTREPPGYCLDGRITWNAVSESSSMYLSKEDRETAVSLDLKYMKYNSEMKGHAQAIGRWLRKNYSNLEKGSSFWYSPETAAGYKSGDLICCTFVPGSVDLRTVLIDGKGKKTHEVKTRN